MFAAEERFWSKVDASGDCWLWTASVDKNGYGWFNWNGRNQRAHRVVWVEMVGAIPDGYTIDHLCRVPSCVNPDHLEPTSLNDNLKRAYGQVTTANAVKTHCRRGHPFDSENTRTRPEGWRVCRPCQRLYQRERANA